MARDAEGEPVAWIGATQQLFPSRGGNVARDSALREGPGLRAEAASAAMSSVASVAVITAVL